MGIKIFFAFLHCLALKRGTKRSYVAKIYDVAILNVSLRYLGSKPKYGFYFCPSECCSTSYFVAETAMIHPLSSSGAVLSYKSV